MEATVQQAVDMEVKGWVVRSDIAVKPAWLKQDQIPGGKPLFDLTENAAEAFVFDDFEYAQTAADIWSDAPGVWRVERV
jgi:hypothetical protein